MLASIQKENQVKSDNILLRSTNVIVYVICILGFFTLYLYPSIKLVYFFKKMQFLLEIVPLCVASYMPRLFRFPSLPTFYDGLSMANCVSLFLRLHPHTFFYISFQDIHVPFLFTECTNFRRK